MSLVRRLTLASQFSSASVGLGLGWVLDHWSWVRWYYDYESQSEVSLRGGVGHGSTRFWTSRCSFTPRRTITIHVRPMVSDLHLTVLRGLEALRTASDHHCTPVRWDPVAVWRLRQGRDREPLARNSQILLSRTHGSLEVARQSIGPGSHGPMIHGFESDVRYASYFVGNG
jgi:hypothetical protein